MSIDRPCHAVAIFGGATAGSMAAEILAQHGCQVVVFEQNPRPYGKIEDGLPRWHDKQRLQEYKKIDERLTRPGVTYVPSTKLGKDLDFVDVATRWGWSAVVLANGSWKDRPLEAAGAAEALGHGLAYQNPFVYWFNHKNEKGYSGTRYHVPDSPLCIGGGLASIDVVKIFQLELFERALRARGVDVDMKEMEHEGIPKYCKAHGVDDPASLGVKNGTLLYRRRLEDMPVASAPKGANEKQLAKVEEVRKKILSKCQANFLFEVLPQTATQRVILEGGKVKGLVVATTKVQGRDAAPVPGTERELRTDLVVSSIGSIPEPIPGVEMTGVYYKFKDPETGQYAALPAVFATGNVVTGQGNIKASLDHGKQVATHLVEQYLGIAARGEPAPITSQAGAAVAAAVASHVATLPPLAPAKVQALIGRAHERQRAIGYTDYRAWHAKVTPPDLE
jgi:ferredoxin--NADP+ reductase